MRTPSQPPSATFSARAGPVPPRSSARRVVRPEPTPRTRPRPPAPTPLTRAHSAIDSRAAAMRKGAAPPRRFLMAQHPRLRYDAVDGADALFTPLFVDYLLTLHDALTPRIRALMARRA